VALSWWEENQRQFCMFFCFPYNIMLLWYLKSMPIQEHGWSLLHKKAKKALSCIKLLLSKGCLFRVVCSVFIFFADTGLLCHREAGSIYSKLFPQTLHFFANIILIYFSFSISHQSGEESFTWLLCMHFTLFDPGFQSWDKFFQAETGFLEWRSQTRPLAEI